MIRGSPKSREEFEAELSRLRDRIAELEQQRAELIIKLQEALNQTWAPGEFLPICSSCKKVRDEKGFWHPVEHYFRQHTRVEFSHGVCPDCARQLYPQAFSEKPSVQ